MANFRQVGEVLHYIPKTGEVIKSNDLVAVGDVVGVAITDGVVGELLAVSVTGVYDVPVPTAAGQITQGDTIYYDKTAKEITRTASGNIFAGFAWADADPGEDVPLRLRF